MSWFSLFFIGPGVSGEVDDSCRRVLNIYVDGYEWATRLEWCGGLHQVEKGVPIDDTKCFDQVANLKKFIERCNSDEEFISLQVHQKWEGQRYFEKAKSIACYSELLKISQFVFALPSHNANVERVFSLMQSQWIKERNQLSVESLKVIIFVQYNFKDTSCKDFHAYLLSNKKLLGKIRSTAKYRWANKED